MASLTENQNQWREILRPHFLNMSGKILQIDIYRLLGLDFHPPIYITTEVAEVMRQLGYRVRDEYFHRGYVEREEQDSQIYIHFDESNPGTFVITKDSIPLWSQRVKKLRRFTLHSVEVTPRGWRGNKHKKQSAQSTDDSRCLGRTVTKALPSGTIHLLP